MILSCSNIQKSFGDESIIKGGSFHMEDHQKVAIVGINGAGKSTLLKMILGELDTDEGTITLSSNTTIGYLAQHQNIEDEMSIYDAVLEEKKDVLVMEEKLHEMESRMDSLAKEELETHMNAYHKLLHEFEDANGYAYKGEVTGILRGLGFKDEEFDKKISTLSGGQKTRVSLCKLLVSKPDLIILDEPTNHLDIDSVVWLEGYLKNYKGAVLVVSHDRYFLDRVVSKVVEISNGIISQYDGNYTDYAKKSKKKREERLRAYLAQQAEIEHQNQVIDKLKQFNREKSIKRAESRKKALDKMEVLEKPIEERSEMRLSLEPEIISGKDVLTLDGVRKSFGLQLLFDNLHELIQRGERVAIIGANGTGKTTLLKMINNLEPFEQGTIRLGSNVEIGYYDQEHHVLHLEKTIYEEISDAYPDLTQTRIRNVLAAFLFTDEDVFKKISTLSGGERGRVSLAKLMLSNANFLILDEPTNHLDIPSKEILEEALKCYTGTVLYVSHDRYFINETATRILLLQDHKLTGYLGNYDYYLEKSSEIGLHETKQSQKETKTSEGKADWKEQKKEAALLRKKNQQIKQIEEEIDKLEGENSKLEELMLLPENVSNSAKLNELSEQLTTNGNRLEELYEKWEELAE
ncbi:ABC-F family ATP-binding cassette domain-containing protein [Eubacterium oxidoreducens]|uniref:ATP-binding cassette, subfamily F, member 3 n=1 Tax=Eubacterium oxidoreducens TaxID=1732 RepID=A0A1G6AKW7_EUBOX|nr:ABC-F family ATP-binding cassette domain-containing protein [Eubacterium oxidoreducens]SDB09041.1 ATP-binding cassette, subfamily F, member 3 [Eubacterium oxidoreducens]